MARNIEFKASINDFDDMVYKVQRLTNKTPEFLDQKDVFYITKNGRLKLRSCSESTPELIFYFRKDTQLPKLSRYYRFGVKHYSLIYTLFNHILGIKGVVQKRRCVFLKDNVRFHIDKVNQLGDFMEIEYIMRKTESQDSALSKVNKMMEALGIKKEMLINCSYGDLILNKN